MKPLSIQRKLFLNIILFFAIFFLSTSVIAQEKKSQDRVFVKIEIKGMSCPYCAFGMEKELKQVSGVDNVQIILKNGLAYISTPIEQKPLKVLLKSIITDAGFTAGKIEYSDKPFVIKKDD